MMVSRSFQFSRKTKHPVKKGHIIQMHASKCEYGRQRVVILPYFTNYSHRASLEIFRTLEGDHVFVVLIRKLLEEQSSR